MRNYLLLSILLFVCACKKESASNNPAMDTVQSGAMAEAKGFFQNGPYGTVTGVGKVVRNGNNTFDVILDSFMTDNGPDLYVYLSKEVMPVTFIEVGKLKATSGTQVYPLTSLPDLTQYKYICIHCKAFNHLFGYASFK
ncbi:MAG: DM13 domain-containing protein [Bacteroidota bacterium]